MKVLLCGDTGFIGRHCRAALLEAGHGVTGLQGWDMATALRPEAWAAQLQGIDAVVNTVGVLRDSARRPMRALHASAPAALFEAAAQHGVRRLIHVSALGIEGSETHYAKTKLEAELALQHLVSAGRLDAVCLRPSVVLGRGGASSALVERLATLPWLPLPEVATTTPIQPISVHDLADVVVTLLTTSPATPGPLACVGPDAAPLSTWIARLRARRGRRPAPVTPLPAAWTRLSAKLGDLLPVTPWGTETLALLGQPNVGDCGPMVELLRRPLRPALDELEM